MNLNGDKCSCEDKSDCESPPPKESKKSKISLSSIAMNLRRGRSLQQKSKRPKKCTSNSCCDPSNNPPSSSANNVESATSTNPKKSSKWHLKFYCGKKEQRRRSSASPTRPESQNCCKCSCYKPTEEVVPLIVGDNVPDEVVSSPPSQESTNEEEVVEPSSPIPAEDEPSVPDVIVNDVEEPENQEANVIPEPEQSDDNEVIPMVHFVVQPNFIDLHAQRPLGQEDVDEEARMQRAREIERGVDPPASFRPARRVQLYCSDENEGPVVKRVQIFCPNDVTVDSLRAIFQNNVTFRTCPLDIITGCHTQVDFIHCLIPDLFNITNCSFYWGKMDRYEAERLLDGKREGTFLLRDSAQEEFVFSVSFRKYGRSLHARIEQWNHKFSFDSHDPGVYTSETVCGLIEHYKDPTSCMFFEPMLTWPLHRNSVFSLQHLCRASIVNRLTYDDVNHLQLPKCLKTYLKEYHYRQKVRVERFDDDVQWLEMNNTN